MLSHDKKMEKYVHRTQKTGVLLQRINNFFHSCLSVLNYLYEQQLWNTFGY
jgi:hypothetical protein